MKAARADERGARRIRPGARNTQQAKRRRRGSEYQLPRFQAWAELGPARDDLSRTELGPAREDVRTASLAISQL